MSVHSYGNNSPQRAKTDKKDTIKLANYAFNHWLALPRYIPEDEVRFMLKTTYQQYQQCAKVQTMLKNNLISLLDVADDTISYKGQPNTSSQYKLVFNGYIAKCKPFYGVKLQDVTHAPIQSYYNNKLKAGLSSNTVYKHHANIHKCLAYAVRLGFIPNNPSDRPEFPPKKKYTGAKAYTPEQMKELLQMFHEDLSSGN